MASLQDIRHRIKSVKSTKQITSAMNMVATSRLRHAKEAATANRPYAQKVSEVVHAVAKNAGMDFSHPLLEKHEDGKKLVFASILRAGTSIADGMLSVVPGARIGHMGLYRDPKTHIAVEYYCKMPSDISERDVIVLDPMLATGNSAAAALR